MRSEIQEAGVKVQFNSALCCRLALYAACRSATEDERSPVRGDSIAGPRRAALNAEFCAMASGECRSSLVERLFAQNMLASVYSESIVARSAINGDGTVLRGWTFLVLPQ